MTVPATGGVDLHTHSTASDGELSPTELVLAAEAAGLEAIGITDHDTVAGIPEALSVRTNVQVVPGIEISCDVPDGTCHMLGYYVDHDSPFLVEPLTFLRRKRRERSTEILARLEKIGIRITLPPRSDDRSIGRPHIALALIEGGFVASIEEAFHRYLATGRPAFVPAPRLVPKEAIEMILRAGGVPVLAHPHTFDNEAMISSYARQGMCGIESDYVTYSSDDIRRWRRMAARLGLVSTGGSDFHGNRRPDRRLGSVRFDVAILEALRKKRRPS